MTPLSLVRMSLTVGEARKSSTLFAFKRALAPPPILATPRNRYTAANFEGNFSVGDRLIGLNYPVLLGNDQVMRAFRIDAFPTTYVVSEDGRIEDAAVGYTTGFGLRWRLWF
jgi:hypothetical protein